MNQMNQIIIEGTIKTVEMKQEICGAYCKLMIEHKRQPKDLHGKKTTDTHFFNVIAYGNLMEKCKGKQGASIRVVGSLRNAFESIFIKADYIGIIGED